MTRVDETAPRATRGASDEAALSSVRALAAAPKTREAVALAVRAPPTKGERVAGDTDRDEGSLYLLELAAGATVRHALPDPESGAPLYDSPFDSCFSPDGSLVVFTSAAWAKQGVVAYDMATREELWSTAYPMEGPAAEEEEAWNALHPRFAVGGRVVLVGAEEGIRAYRARDGVELARLRCGSTTQIDFATDDARRRAWVMTGPGPTSFPYSDDWK